MERLEETHTLLQSSIPLHMTQPVSFQSLAKCHENHFCTGQYFCRAGFPGKGDWPLLSEAGFLNSEVWNCYYRILICCCFLEVLVAFQNIRFSKQSPSSEAKSWSPLQSSGHHLSSPVTLYQVHLSNRFSLWSISLSFADLNVIFVFIFDSSMHKNTTEKWKVAAWFIIRMISCYF